MVKFSSKGNTLNKLKTIVLKAKIAPLSIIDANSFLKTNSLSNINFKELGAGPFIVRSSSSNEDTLHSSNAGAYLSILNVKKDDLRDSIKNVINSYDKVKNNDQVLIQPMIQNVIMSGVAFSHDPNTCSPYKVINWTEGSKTDEVTSGKKSYCWYQTSVLKNKIPKHIKMVNDLIDELLDIFSNNPIDCEFAITKQSKKTELWLLQARPLILQDKPIKEGTLHKNLSDIEKKIKFEMAPKDFILGEKTVFGVMPDWNPAEIIGIRPRPLSLSLYRDLITDSMWAYQRNNYGYRNLRSFPLMVNFYGLPYIDVRSSFNSFIPNLLEEKLSRKLVSYYINKLSEKPILHDKVEFDIVFSCYTLDIEERLKQLKNFGFSSDDLIKIANSLRNLTNNVLDSKKGLWKTDAQKISVLTKKRENLLKSSINPIEKIYWLIEDGKRYGTLPFAGLARAGFIAVQMLNSLVTTGIFSQEDHDNFLHNITTISSNLLNDQKKLNKQKFLKKYGHLRPGTYDILSPRYDSMPNNYFNWNTTSKNEENNIQPFSLTIDQIKKTENLLKKHKLHISVVDFFDFLKKAIELRESSKFEFTKNLSETLEIIALYAKELKFNLEDISMCNIQIFKELYISTTSPKRAIRKSIKEGSRIFKKTKYINLPSLILNYTDVWGFKLLDTEPNFITQKHITSNPVDFKEKNKLSGSIVFIPNADPGFDWLFSHKIAGLITTWGGANSHMAIRSGELGIPAVIGAGELNYKLWKTARILEIDCLSRKVEVIQ